MEAPRDKAVGSPPISTHQVECVRHCSDGLQPHYCSPLIGWTGPRGKDHPPHPTSLYPCMNVAAGSRCREFGVGSWVDPDPKVSRVGWSQKKGHELCSSGPIGMMAVTCFLIPPPPAGVDLSNIVKLAPRVSADGPQEPTHDILQVGKGGPCGQG